MSVISQSEGRDTLVILDRASFKPAHMESFPAEIRVLSHFWATSERLVIEIERSGGQTTRPQTYTELFGVNADGSRSTLLFGINAGERQTGSHVKRRKFMRANVEVVSLLPEEEDSILIAYEPWGSEGIWDKREKILTTLNIYTGRTSNFTIEAPGLSSQVITTPQGQLKFASGFSSGGKKLRHIRSERNWVPLASKSSSSLLALSATSDKLYALKQAKSQAAPDRLVAVALNGQDETTLYTAKERAIKEALIPVDGGAPFALVLEGTPEAYVFLAGDSKEKQVFKTLLTEFSGYDFEVLSSDNQQESWTLQVNVSDSDQRFYLYDQKAQELQLILANQ
ncbi:hypothetical protein AWR36_005755 [Microbulbifer flavimaris]|uniref:Uncharacterized protein n=1 Tax=Microbulbifer flavimaris TaxID=1781068 RepID=A0ABX4I149_9GAMM|nr:MULTISPECIES: hypothetical protein [Microbulbifer]KUJ83368.1 hypothetical protein AVO43_05745 [Microbulbifer sp. ZGT114]PCO05523.1 hypothetical protein AWR36_005755 [Microbulbifer flavimaris]